MHAHNVKMNIELSEKDALEAQRRKDFLEAVAAGVEALRNDPEAWAEEQAERAEWETTSADGLEG
jgi:hypothetical protein